MRSTVLGDAEGSACSGRCYDGSLIKRALSADLAKGEIKIVERNL